MILLTYGTRPEYIKIKPLFDKLEKNHISYKVLFTGQHKDIVPRHCDYVLDFKEYSNNRLNNVLINCLLIPDEWLENIEYILVQGDTTSVLGVALTAFHKKIKVIHLESGLRTYDYNHPYPEEINRQIVSRISNINFCPTESNLKNLIDEKILGKSFVVGNTILDNLLSYKKDCEYTKKILITLHRSENHSMIDVWFKTINEIASEYPDYEFILPIHPNPNVFKYKHLLTNLTVLSPLPHEDLIKILIKCSLVITDSGGLQEECSFFNKKCIVCRNTTERQESLNKSSYLVKSPEDLKKKFFQFLKNFEFDYISPYGDGHSSDKIIKLLKKNLIK
jgi:UDP-N-acetylglucosamine 2-epimerase (non-hydrolysing)